MLSLWVALSALAMAVWWALAVYSCRGVLDFAAVDKCLDSGGSWNYREDRCAH